MQYISNSLYMGHVLFIYKNMNKYDRLYSIIWYRTYQAITYEPIAASFK